MTTYYVDSVNGSDAASGLSRSAAWQSFANLNAMATNTLTGGDEIVLVDGSTWTGEYINFSPFATAGVLGAFLPLGGNAQNTSRTSPITIRRSGGGARPVINCNAVAAAGLVLDGGAYSISGIEIKNSLAYGIYITMDVFATDPPSYVVRDCLIHDCAYDGVSIGEQATGTASTRTHEIAYNTVYNCNNDGISLQGNSSVVLIHHNIVHDIGISSPFDVTSGDGITAHASADGLRIFSNIVYNCVDGINVVNAGSTNRNVFERNWIYDCNEHCIWVTTDTTSVTKWDIWNNVLGMKSGMNAVGDATHATGAGVTVGWVTDDFGATATNQVHDTRIWHNTFYNATTDVPCIILRANGASGGSSVWSVLGNVMDTTSTGRYQNWHRNGTTPTITSDRNVYDTARANGWIYDGAASATIAAWRTATSKDANSVVGDPSLVGNATTAIDNARLQSGSNAIGLASNATATMPEDWSGRRRPAAGAWDAGAFHRYAAPTPGTGSGSRLLSGMGI